jgi:hypothetical protein
LSFFPHFFFIFLIFFIFFLFLLHQAENESQTGQQAGGALTKANEAAMHALAGPGNKADAATGKRTLQ